MARLNTFLPAWPGPKELSIFQLAQSGFYYSGIRDQTECYFCKLKLRNWDKTDIPFVEHACHQPKCGHVIREKGRSFIQDAPMIKSQIKLKNLNDWIASLKPSKDEAENITLCQALI